MTVDRKRMLELCDALAGSGLGLTWSMRTRIALVDEELLRAARRGGCDQVDYEVESGHRPTLARIHARHTLEEVERVVPLTAGLGMKPYAFFILGFPWDTPETVDETQRLMEELAPYIDRFHPAMAALLIPLPGTEIYETYKDEHGFAGWWFATSAPTTSPFRTGAAGSRREVHPRRRARRRLLPLLARRTPQDRWRGGVHVAAQPATQLLGRAIRQAGRLRDVATSARPVACARTSLSGRASSHRHGSPLLATRSMASTSCAIETASPGAGSGRARGGRGRARCTCRR